MPTARQTARPMPGAVVKRVEGAILPFRVSEMFITLVMLGGMPDRWVLH